MSYQELLFNHKVQKLCFESSKAIPVAQRIEINLSTLIFL